MSLSEESFDHREPATDEACAADLDNLSAQCPRGQGTLKGAGEPVGGFPSPTFFVTRYCEIDGKPFRLKKGGGRNKMTCSSRCRKEKSRRKLDPERGSSARKEAQLDGFEKIYGGTRKAIIQDLSKAGLLPPTPMGALEEDPTSFYDLQHRRLHARRPAPLGDPTGDEVYHHLRHQVEEYERVKLTTRIERNRMLDQQIQEQTKRMAAVADSLDETFDLTQRQWLDLKAIMTTYARLIVERYPDFPQCKDIRSDAERILALDAGSSEA